MTNWIDLRMKEWDKKYERKWPVIIALQGDPYSGKTALANLLVEWMKYPVIRLEEILEILSPTTPESAGTLISQAFDVIAQIVKTHTSLGFSVVVDSPLARRSHLDKLVGVLKEHIGLCPSLLIIECCRKSRYVQQMRFERRDSSKSIKWYKPQDWPPAPSFIGRDYTDDDIQPLVSKLVVDTTSPLSMPQMVAAVHDLTASLKTHKVDFNNWQPINSDNPHLCPNFTSYQNKFEFPFPTQHIHSITIYKEEGINYDATCGVCQRQINNNNNRGIYTCKYCPLALHKSCAELKGNEDNYFTPKTFPKFFHKDPKKLGFCFPEEHLCVYCREEGKDFSYECTSCIFECHLKCMLFPTVLHHRGHEHWLSFTLIPTSKRNFVWCNGCHGKMEDVGYACSECSVGCRTYHPECLFFPPFVWKHDHGGYTCDLEMMIQRTKEQEDYICALCFKTMHPDSWYYDCSHCFLQFHLDCAFEEFR